VKTGKKYGLLAGGVGLAAVVALVPGSASAGNNDPFTGGVQPAANPRAGVQDSALVSSLDETSVAWGQLPLTNPDTANGITHDGYNTSNQGPLTQDPHEAFKTEPDKNAYLVFNGHHYLFQGHEGGPRGYVTRINLDEFDPRTKAPTVTLIAEAPPVLDPTGQQVFPTFDGITWDPWTSQLLVTAESAAPVGGVYAVPLDVNGNSASLQMTRLPALGSGGYEGIQNDSDGNVWIVEDIGGKDPGTTNGKRPNSYVYRFRPSHGDDLSQGTLEALQVLRQNGAPVTAAELLSGTDPFIGQLHTYGATFQTRWMPVNPADSTAGAAAAGATPFKRPENGVFRPGTNFTEFYFTETGDTNASSTLPGAFGGVFKVTQSGPSADTGRIEPVTIGDVEHTGFDNISFATRDQLLVVEDAGDLLHGQRNALDSGYVIDVRNGQTSRTPSRFLAEGRDASATYDALFSPGYNDGDNEVTGIHTSDGDVTPAGILGAQVPTPFSNGWRIFWTQQHGDNVTWELMRDTRNVHTDDDHGHR
jgi:hypothetical protein